MPGGVRFGVAVRGIGRTLEFRYTLFDELLETLSLLWGEHPYPMAYAGSRSLHTRKVPGMTCNLLSTAARGFLLRSFWPAMTR
jgi:hypothetical protein